MGVIVPAGAGARAGVQGYDPKAHDPFFDGLSDSLADKGFVVAALDDVVTWARTGSLMWMTFRACVLRGRDDAGVDAAL